MRQAGILAAAGLYALENNVQRLAEDHANAARLAKGLQELGIASRLNTNMVLAEVDSGRVSQLQEFLKNKGVLVLARAPMRLVTHLDVDAAGIDRALGAFQAFFRQ